MKKLFYLSSSQLVQADIEIIPYLSKEYDLIYCVIIPSRNANFTKSELIDYCNQRHIRFQIFQFKHRLRDPRIVFSFIKVLKSIRRYNPDIIFTQDYYGNPLLSLLSLTLDKDKTIVLFHDVEPHSSSPFYKIFKVGMDISMAHFKYFQVFSKQQEDILRKDYPQKEVYMIPLPLSQFGNYNPEGSDHCKKSKIRFLFFGNIMPYKGPKILLEAVNILSKKYSEFEVMIAGRCNDWMKDYEPLIEAKDRIIREIRFINNSEIAGLFCESHYLVLPYKDATQSGPLMIAYNYNLPVIASNIEAFKDCVEENVSGFFFNSEDPQSLALVMEAAILRDEKEYNALKRRLENYVKDKYSIDEIIEKYQRMIEDYTQKTKSLKREKYSVTRRQQKQQKEGNEI